MTRQSKTVEFKPNKSTEYFKSLFRVTYIAGWPNFWITDPEVPVLFKKCHYVLSKLVTTLTWIFIGAEIACVFTQKNLTEKQSSDSKVYNISHPGLCCFGYILSYYQETYTDILRTLAIKLKEDYNDEKVELYTIKKSRIYSRALVGICCTTMTTYGLNGLLDMSTGGTFVTAITVWPDVNEHSTLASIVRVIIYISFWIVLGRAFVMLVILSTTLIFLGEQFKQLQSYFNSLNDIFVKTMPQNEMEKSYEEAYVIGIKMHSRTLSCVRKCQRSCHLIYSIHIVVNISVIILLMSQMIESERTLSKTMSTIFSMTSMLVSTGFVMWNAGDLTVEASRLPTAMFHSGWHNCQTEASVRIRKLLTISMAQAEIPVNMVAVAVVNLSYDSFLSIVKSSYSVFSVLY